MTISTRTTNPGRPMFLAAVCLALAGTTACDSGDDGTGGTGGATSSSTASTTSSTTTSSTATSGSTTSSASSGTGGAPGAPEFVAALDATQGQLAEGLFVTGNEAYVGLAVLGQIKKIDLPGGAVHDFGSIPTPPANSGFMLGIVVDPAGNAYVGFGGGPGTPVTNGIYKIPAAGGAVTTPFATDPAMNFPNGLWLDASTDIYVADSGGSIFKVKSDGTTTTWKTDPTLDGSDTSCAHGAPFPIGANGIVRIGNDFWVSNTNLGSIVKIAIQNDGSAGAATVVAGPDCNLLGGVDGIAPAPSGGGVVAVSNGQNQVLHIDGSGAVTKLYEGAPLDNPGSIFVVGPTAYITNTAFFDMNTPAPGLLSYVLP